MSKNSLTGVLVGMGFRPAGKLVLEHLRAGTALQLQAEPENPYDEHAVKVLVHASEIPESEHEMLAIELPGYGLDLETLLQQAEPFWIGYLASNRNKILAGTAYEPNETFNAARAMVPWESCDIRLGFDMKGLPLVVLTAPATAEPS